MPQAHGITPCDVITSQSEGSTGAPAAAAPPPNGAFPAPQFGKRRERMGVCRDVLDTRKCAWGGSAFSSSLCPPQPPSSPHGLAAPLIHLCTQAHPTRASPPFSAEPRWENVGLSLSCRTSHKGASRKTRGGSACRAQRCLFIKNQLHHIPSADTETRHKFTTSVKTRPETFRICEAQPKYSLKNICRRHLAPYLLKRGSPTQKWNSREILSHGLMSSCMWLSKNSWKRKGGQVPVCVKEHEFRCVLESSISPSKKENVSRKLQASALNSLS